MTDDVALRSAAATRSPGTAVGAFRRSTVVLDRRDWLIMAALAAFAFAIAIVNLGFPNDRYFDEVYFPLSAAQYLHGLPQREWTHPPVVKLFIALSILIAGDDPFGWRFLNVVIGSLEVGLLYAFAKRLTASTPIAALAGALLALDGFHLAEQRIATGEITISFVGLATLYAFHRFHTASRGRVAAARGVFGRVFWTTIACGVPCAAAFALLANLQPANHVPTEFIAQDIANTAGPDAVSYATAFAYAMLAVYLLARLVVVPRARDADAAATTPEARPWFVVLCVSLGVLIACKWNGFFVAFAVVTLLVANALPRFGARRATQPSAPWDPGIVLPALAFSCATVYALAYVPTLLREHGHTLADILALQWQMFYYHSHLTGTHPYMSRWWQWPIMQTPIVYYWADLRTGAALDDPSACCIREIIALPNPFVFLLGLVSVPFTAWLAWRERNAGYTLLVVAYLCQWVPWMGSPRMLFEYHFFPNLAIIVLCDAILAAWVLARVARPRLVLATYGAAVIAAFVFFYPVVTAMPLAWNAWHARMIPDVLGIPYTSWIMPHPDRP